VTPSVATSGDTNPSDATASVRKNGLNLFVTVWLKWTWHRCHTKHRL